MLLYTQLLGVKTSTQNLFTVNTAELLNISNDYLILSDSGLRAICTKDRKM